VDRHLPDPRTRETRDDVESSATAATGYITAVLFQSKLSLPLLYQPASQPTQHACLALLVLWAMNATAQTRTPVKNQLTQLCVGSARRQEGRTFVHASTVSDFYLSLH